MNPTTAIAFPLLPVVALSGTLLGVSALGGLYSLSLETKSASLSREIAQLSDELGRETRQLQFTNTEIAAASSPEVIRQRINDLKLPLAPPRQDQILRGSQMPTLNRPRAGGLP